MISSNEKYMFNKIQKPPCLRAAFADLFSLFSNACEPYNECAAIRVTYVRADE
jgi:hypothetical protein